MINKLRYFPRWFTNSTFRVFLYSFGGCGTRMLHSFIEKYYLTNHQSNAHHGFVEKLRRGERAIYLYGDPINALKSFYRKEKENGNFLKLHAHNLRIKKEIPSTLQEYAMRGEDLFQLKAHFERYLNQNNRNYPMLIVNYEGIWKNLDSILKYIDIRDKKKYFPARRSRKGDSFKLASDYEHKLYQIYKPMLSKIKKMPEVYVSNPKK